MKTTNARLPLLAVFAWLLFSSAAAQVDPGPGGPLGPAPTPIDVVQRYYPSGAMGDGESGTKFLQFQDASTEKPHSPPDCVKVSYTPGPALFAGIYWQNKPNNWGEKLGEDFSKQGFKFVTFWARGETGTEKVEFKIGGIDAGKAYKDLCETTLGKLTLTKDWKRYRIPLSGCNLSSMIGVFCFTVSAASNPKGVTFYLDDVLYE